MMPAIDLSRGLVIDLPITAGAGRTVRNVTGYPHHLEFVNAPSWIGGRQGRALQFTAGSSTYCATASVSSLKGVRELSVFAWVRIPAGVPASPIIAQSNITTQYSFALTVSGIQATRFRAIVSSNGLATDPNAKVYDSSTAFSVFDNFYHHVGFTWSGIHNQMTLYADAMVDPNPVVGSDGNISSLHATAARLTLGATDNPSLFFTGEIANVRVWRRFLSRPEVIQDFADSRFDQDVSIKAA